MDHIKTHILVTGGGAPGAYGILTALRGLNRVKLFSCDIYLNRISNSCPLDIKFTQEENVHKLDIKWAL